MRLSTGTFLSLGLLLSISLAGCKTGTIELGDGAGGGSDTGTSGDGGADTGSAGDTGAPDPDPEPEPVVRDGTYVGPFEIEGVADGLGGDVCVGEIELDVAADANPEIDGVADCEFQGALNWLGPQQVVLTGAATEDPEVAGDLSYDLEGASFESEWSGAYEGDDEAPVMVGAFEGETPYEVLGYKVNISFSGSFEAERE